MKTRIKDGTITSASDYERDLYLMFLNAMMYNRPDSDIFKMTEEVRI